jgi:hypothetical protein
MLHVLAPAIVTLLLGAQAQAPRTLDAHGTIKRVDAEKGFMVVFANGQDRHLKIADDVKFSGLDGKPLAGGIKAAELKEGTDVTITVRVPEDGPVLMALRLGRVPLAGARPAGSRPPS